MKTFQKNLDDISKTGHYSDSFSNVRINYDEVVYIPISLDQLKSRLREKCKRYFSEGIME